jgi:hypothetical protein
MRGRPAKRKRGTLASKDGYQRDPEFLEDMMRHTLILTVAAFAAFSAPAFAQSSPASPVMPAPRSDSAPNSNVAPMESAPAPSVPEGRAAAPMEHSAPNGNMGAKTRSGANGS